MYRNKNRGYQKLRVWGDAIHLYSEVASIYGRMPYELRRVISQQLASVDSIHRNIAEGYCSRTLKQYIQHLYYALRSLGESVSGLYACHAADQLADEPFKNLDALCFKLENSLLKLVERLEEKEETGDWVDKLILKESNESYSA